jgi:hypothetical protein
VLELNEHDVEFVEQLITTPTALQDIIDRVAEVLPHVEDPVTFTRSALAKLAQGSRASVRFIDAVPTWTRIQPPTRD